MNSCAECGVRNEYGAHFVLGMCNDCLRRVQGRFAHAWNTFQYAYRSTGRTTTRESTLDRMRRETQEQMKREYRTEPSFKDCSKDLIMTKVKGVWVYVPPTDYAHTTEP